MSYLCVRQQLNHLSKEEYLILKELSYIAKNLYNECLYNVRQHFFESNKYLFYQQNYQKVKNSENYKTLNSNIAYQVLMKVDHEFSLFFNELKNKEHNHEIHIPYYLGELPPLMKLNFQTSKVAKCL